MASGYSPLWLRILYKITPFLFIECPSYNMHWVWKNTCSCGVYEGYGDLIYIDGHWVPTD